MTVTQTEGMLFTPLKFRTFESPNRIGMSPHSTMFAVDGRITEKHLKYYGLRAKNRVGTLFVGGLRVAPSALGAGCQISVADDEAISGLTALAHEVHAEGSKIVGQLLHPGLERSGGDVDLATVSPSSSLSPGKSHQPHVLTTAEVDDLIQTYARAAARCAEAGFDGVEIHAAHGYLGHSFLSPVDNHRNDEYGADRTLFLKKIIQACQESTDFSISVGARISMDDFYSRKGTLSVDDMVAAAVELAEAGLDFLDCSFTSELSAIPDMPFTPFAMESTVAKFRQALPACIPVLAVGRILRPEDAEQGLQRGSCDGVLMARSLIADPEWAEKAYQGRTQDIRPCIGCNQGCAGRIHVGREMRCLTNPEAGHEADWGILKNVGKVDDRSRRVCVVGGGLAGLEAARVAASLGAHVTLYEQSALLGGQARIAGDQYSRGDFSGAYEWRLRELERLEVTVHVGREMTPASMDDLSVDTLIIATGVADALVPQDGQPPRVPIEHAGQVRWDDLDYVCIIDRAGEISALSTAIDAAARGIKTALISHGEVPAERVPKASRHGRLRQAHDEGVNIYRTSVYAGIEGGELQLTSNFGGESHTSIPGYSGNGIVLETGMPMMSAPSVAVALQSWARSRNIPYEIVGDAYSRRDALHAIREGYLAARKVMGESVPEVLSF